MQDNLIFESKKYISARRASEISDYSSDYVGQLCRAGKLDCRMVGRSWFVSEASLLAYQQMVASEENNRNRIKNLRRNDNKKSEALLPITDDVCDITKFDPCSVGQIDSEPVSAEPIHHEGQKTLVYSSDDRPLIPEIKPALEEESDSHSVSEDDSAVAVKAVSLPSPIKISDLSRSVILKRVIKTSSAIAILLLLIVSLVSVLSFSVNPTDLSAREKDLSANALSSVTRFLSHGFNQVLGLFKGEDKKLAVRDDYDYAPSDTITEEGLAVFPSTGSESADYALKQKIRNNFSDEVEVRPDESGTAGVITPVFRQVKGTDFVYVMVPINGSRAP